MSNQQPDPAPPMIFHFETLLQDLNPSPEGNECSTQVGDDAAYEELNKRPYAFKAFFEDVSYCFNIQIIMQNSYQ